MNQTPPLCQSFDNQPIISQKRINDIDALRGITLLGILLVHTVGLFGFDKSQSLYEFSHMGLRLGQFISQYLSNRCAPIFCMLFGVSFYLILKNPNYSGWKFAWRCVLLIGIGLFNKIFYTYDALMWYGIWGLVLLSVRNCTPRIILAISVIAFIAAAFLQKLSLGDLLPLPSARYVENYTLRDLLSYPLSDSICSYLRVVLNGGIFTSFSYMVFGYWMARKKLMNNIKNWATPKTILILFVTYIVFYKGGWYLHTPMLSKIGCAFGAAFMATLFLSIYGLFPRGMKLLEAYGRMGLTNYSFQGVIGTCSLALFLLPHKVDFVYILLYFILVYIFQCLFSYVWLKYFKYGPMEYIWRSMVNLQFANPLK